MATVTIPYGGQSITIDVSDLASEATLRDIFQESKEQSQLLNAIAQRLGATVEREIKAEDRNTDRLIRAIQEEGKKSDSRLGGMLSRLRSGVTRGIVGGSGSIARTTASASGGVFNAMSGVAGNESGSEMSRELFGALGLGAMGAQLGTLFGIMEEFGHTMSNLRRVGTGYAEDLQTFRSSAAEIGLSLEHFGAIVATSGVAVSALGENTTDGAHRLLNLTNTFRENTRELGYFGLQSREMARLIADEAEIRRGMLQTDLRNEQVQANLITSLQEQLELNEQMSQLTGQDVRDRIRASQAFRSEATNAAILARLNEDQRVAANSAIEGLTQLGASASPMLNTAISNILGGMAPDVMNEGFSEFAAFAQSAGVDVRGALQNIVGMIESGVDPETVAGAADQLANQFRNIAPDDTLIRQSLAGSQGAAAVLQARMESVSTGADSLAGSVTLIDEAAQRMQEAMDAGTLALSGTAAEMERFGAELRNTLMEEILDAFDMDINSSDFPAFVRSLADFPSSDGFRDAISFMTEVTTMLSGAQGLMGLMRDNQSAAQGENLAFMASILGAMGLPGADQLRLLAIGLEGDELAPEIQSILNNMFGVDPNDPEGGEPTGIHGMLNSLLEGYASTSREIKEAIDNGASVQEALLLAITTLNGLLPTLPGPAPGTQ
jgi:hypothetical protein